MLGRFVSQIYCHIKRPTLLSSGHFTEYEKINEKTISGWALDGGVAQWTSHPPVELQTRVRFPPECNALKNFHSDDVVYN
jgi:hypothetical protein